MKGDHRSRRTRIKASLNKHQRQTRNRNHLIRSDLKKCIKGSPVEVFHPCNERIDRVHMGQGKMKVYLRNKNMEHVEKGLSETQEAEKETLEEEDDAVFLKKQHRKFGRPSMAPSPSTSRKKKRK